MRSTRIYLLVVLSLCLTFFAGCSGKTPGKKDGAPRHIPRNLDRIPDAVPRVEPLSRYGNRFKHSNSYVTLNKRYFVMPTSRGYCAEGKASWYGTKFHGNRTSSGERYDMFAMTAAHRTLPLPTFAKVTNLANGKSVIVKVNDRGPFHCNRLIDLSYVAAHKLGILGRGTGQVRVESVDPRDHGGRVPKGKPRFARLARSSETPVINDNTQTVGKSPAEKQLYLQLGAFSERKNAEALVKQLDQFSPHPSQVTEKAKESKARYRVIVGPLRNQQEANRLSQQLANAKFPLALIITE